MIKYGARHFISEDENSLLSKFVLTGRLQGDYHSFENDETGESASDFDWRRFRFGFKASILDGFTLHSEANLNLNQPEPLYTNLTDTYLSWTTDNGLKFKVGKQSAPFTLDGSDFVQEATYLERGKINPMVWSEYFPGLLSGSNYEWDYLQEYIPRIMRQSSPMHSITVNSALFLWDVIGRNPLGTTRPLFVSTLCCRTMTR